MKNFVYNLRQVIKLKLTMLELVNYCKQYGFIFQGSEIYNGLANSWDYGPLGTNLKENIRNIWKKKFIQENPYNVGLDSAILMNPKVWIASGHVASFADPLIDCKKCKTRFRADKLIADFTNNQVVSENWENKQLEEYIKENKIKCPKCGAQDFTSIRKFNLLFETSLGVTEDTKNTIYLRGETAQGIFINFKNVERSLRLKIPFGIAQTGKAFRNEITPGNFIFRTREFEQMELEFFCQPNTDLEWFGYWKNFCLDFLKTLGLDNDKLRLRDHQKEELSFYSKATTDIEYLYPTGWGELWGIADRTDYDLSVHENYSGEDLHYLDPETNEKYLPYVIEPSVGLDRLFLALLVNSYTQEITNNEQRLILKIHPALAPYKVAIFPLVKKLHRNKANDIYALLCKHFACSYDETGSIGKRYRRSDAIGTPLAITIDDETIKNDTVTVRNRDTMEQIKLKTTELVDYVNQIIEI